MEKREGGMWGLETHFIETAKIYYNKKYSKRYRIRINLETKI